MTRAESAGNAAAVLDLHRQGYRCAEIAARLDCTVYRVWYVLQSRGVAPPRRRDQRLLAEIFGGPS